MDLQELLLWKSQVKIELNALQEKLLNTPPEERNRVSTLIYLKKVEYDNVNMQIEVHYQRATHCVEG